MGTNIDRVEGLHWKRLGDPSTWCRSHLFVQGPAGGPSLNFYMCWNSSVKAEWRFQVLLANLSHIYRVTCGSSLNIPWVCSLLRRTDTLYIPMIRPFVFLHQASPTAARRKRNLIPMGNLGHSRSDLPLERSIPLQVNGDSMFQWGGRDLTISSTLVQHKNK